MRHLLTRIPKSLFALLLLALLFIGAAAAKTDTDWVTVERPFWRLKFPRQFGDDARAVDTMMERATKELSTLFGEPDPARLLDNTFVEVMTHPDGCRHASYSHASMESNMRWDGYQARIHLLAPSIFSQYAVGRTSPTDAVDTYYRILLHEYSSVFVQRLILSKSGGWQYHEADPWFLQGFDEFIASRGADGERFTERLEKRLAPIRRQPDRVKFAGHIKVTDPYGDGFAVVAFLADTFGPEAVRRIWLSPERTFSRAVEATLGADYPALQSKWTEWLAQKSIRP